jgi:hypothetical protein
MPSMRAAVDPRIEGRRRADPCPPQFSSEVFLAPFLSPYLPSHG